MRKKYLISGMVLFIASILVLMGVPGKASAAEIVSITPSAQDMTDQISQGGAPENVTLFGFLTAIGTEYTAVISTDEGPAMVVTPGASMSMDELWSYDETAKTVTVKFTAKKMIGAQGDFPEGKTMSILAMVPAVEDGEDGPPEEMTGAWMATDLQQWELIPPQPGKPYFGFSLTGPEGAKGFFHMFIPTALIDLLGQMSGKTLTAEELAVFNGDSQSSLSMQEVTGGVLIKINVTFSSTSTEVSSSAKKSITKKITVREQLAISLAAKSTTVKKGGKATLYGWTKDEKFNKQVTLWAKVKGEKEFKKVGTVKTRKDGYFTTNLKVSKTTTYKAKYKKSSSTEQSVTVK